MERNVYKIEEVYMHKYYKIPKELFENEYYKDLSSNAKLLYAILLDRLTLSMKNNWVNEKGELYLILTREEAMELLSISSKTTITKVYSELKEKELIYEERQGLNRPNLIYIGKIDYTKGKNVDISRKYRKCTSGSTESVLQEVHKVYGINTDNINKLEEEEESGEKQKLSTELTHRYQTIFNRKLSANFEKEILNLYNDETIIEYCLTLAELQADKPVWLIATLKDWKENNLNTVEEIEEYLNNRKNTGKKGKPVKGDSVPKIDENIVNMELNEEDINIINDLHNKYKDSPLSPYYSKKNTELIFKIYKAKSPVKNLNYIKQKMMSIDHIKTTPEKIANNFDFYIKISEGYR